MHVPLHHTHTTPNSASLSYDVMEYLVSEMEHLHSATKIFSKYFPNILKVRSLSTSLIIFS